MPTPSGREGVRTAVAMGALLVVPALCCGLPLLIAGGALAGIGSVLGSPWVIGSGVALLVGVVGWRVYRRASPPTVDRDCCSPTPPARESAPSGRQP